MKISNNDVIIIPAEKIEETETAVVITYQGKRTIINNAAVMSDSFKSGNIVFAKICNTRLSVIALPIYSDEKHDCSIADNPVGDSVRSFTIEEFVDIYLNSLEVRTAISDGKYAFYRDNLIPSNWTMLNSEGLNTALKKIEDMPILSKKRINDRIIYQIDDFASKIPVFTSRNVDEIMENYSFTKSSSDTVGTFLGFLMKQKGIISARLFDMTGIDKSTISEYLNDKRSQQKNYLVAISIALRLLPKQSTYLLSLADISIGKNGDENKLYQLFLDSCAFNEEITVYKCNEILISKGLPPLTNLRVAN